MKTKRAVNGSGSVTAWLFAGPYVLFLFAFGLFPAGYAIAESFNQETTSGGFGIANFVHVATDFRFLPAVLHVGEFMLIWVPVMVIGTLLLALLLHEKVDRSTTVFRLIYFLPGAVTGSAAVLLWYFMLDPALSPFGPELKAIGLTSTNAVFTNGNLPWIFALVAFVTGVGQWIVIMFGALQGISDEQIEAARVDGASPVRIAISIKLPSISKYIIYMVILAFAGALQIFVEPSLFFSITEAGSSWWSLNQLGYAFAFQQGDFGQAAVVSVVLLVLSVIAAMILIFKTNFFQTDVED